MPLLYLITRCSTKAQPSCSSILTDIQQYQSLAHVHGYMQWQKTQKTAQLLYSKQCQLHKDHTDVENYLTADVNFAVVSDNKLIAASSSPSRPYKLSHTHCQFHNNHLLYRSKAQTWQTVRWAAFRLSTGAILADICPPWCHKWELNPSSGELLQIIMKKLNVHRHLINSTSDLDEQKLDMAVRKH